MSSFQFQSQEVLARLNPFGIRFEKSLSDLIEGIRAHSKKSPESLLEFLERALQECKEELATTDLELKATAILKLAYLEMYGFDMSWCNFQILEVMSSAKFQQKRIGYLATMQSFKSEQNLLILATNQFKKDLNSHNYIEVGLALSGIATIVTPHLAQDIVDDVLLKLTHSKPYIRKKAVLALFKIFIQYPESLRQSLPRVIEKLDDPDIAVVSATLTVICEISKNNPQIFLSYLPKFFAILSDTTNNWLIIRILKLFQSLLKIEPRMKKKILPSIKELMAKTDATSLVYECINCIVNGNMLTPDSSRDKETAKECINRLMNFFVTNDSNLKFVGLLALINVLKVFPEFMYKIKGISDVVMDCLTDKDLIIKRKALEVCHYLVNEDNMANVVKVLLLQLVPGEGSSRIPESLKLEITAKVIEISSSNNYENVPNFKWYVTALKELVNLSLLPTAGQSVQKKAHDASFRLSQVLLGEISLILGAEFTSVAAKVPSIRSFLLDKVVGELVKDARVLDHCPLLLKDIYWIAGEYVDDLEDDSEDGSGNSLGEKIQILNALVNPYWAKNSRGASVSAKLVNADHAVIVSAIPSLVKIFNSIVLEYRDRYTYDGKIPHQKADELGFFLHKLIQTLEFWATHPRFEVQERALYWIEFLKLCMDALNKGDTLEIQKLQSEEEKYFETLLKKDVETKEELETDELEDESESDQSSTEESDVSSQNEDTSASIECPTTQEETGERENVALPLLLIEVLPSFFKSYELNPVSNTAQKRIPVPEELDLNSELFAPPEYCFAVSEPSSDDEPVDEEEATSTTAEADLATTRVRLERLKDDPYYILGSQKASKSKHKKIVFEDGVEVSPSPTSELEIVSSEAAPKSKKSKKLKKEKVVILTEETLGEEPETNDVASYDNTTKMKKKKSKFIVDSMNLDNLNLDLSSTPEMQASTSSFNGYEVDIESMRRELAEKEAKKAAKEERKRKKKATAKMVAESVADRLNQNLDDLAANTETVLEVAVQVPEPLEGHIVAVPKRTKKKKKKAVILE